jgi:hypothetical protein
MKEAEADPAEGEDEDDLVDLDSVALRVSEVTRGVAIGGVMSFGNGRNGAGRALAASVAVCGCYVAYNPARLHETTSDGVGAHAF